MLSFFLAAVLATQPNQHSVPSQRPNAATPAPISEGFVVRIPPTLSGAPGELISISAESGAPLVSWNASPGIRLVNDDPPDAAGKAKLLHAAKAGTYFVVAMIPTDKGVRSDICIVTIGKPAPRPDDPPPVDPPADKAPIPAPGFRVLIVYETADLPKYSKGQLATLYGADVRNYLSSKCVKGDDGKTAEWRIWDKDVVTAGESALWQEAMRRPRGKLPTILISDGKTGYEGPLPDSIADTLALLKRFGN